MRLGLGGLYVYRLWRALLCNFVLLPWGDLNTRYWLLMFSQRCSTIGFDPYSCVWRMILRLFLAP